MAYRAQNPVGLFFYRGNNSGSLAIFAAIRRVSSRVSNFAGGSRRDIAGLRGKDAKADWKCSDVGKHPHRAMTGIAYYYWIGTEDMFAVYVAAGLMVLAGVGARYVGANNLRFDRFGE
jgi:hypothetical protein